MGFNDTKNIHGRLRSGYELVRADEYDSEEYPVVARRKTRWSHWSRWPSPGKDTRRTCAQQRMDYQRKQTDGQDEAD